MATLPSAVVGWHLSSTRNECLLPTKVRDKNYALMQYLETMLWFLDYPPRVYPKDEEALYNGMQSFLFSRQCLKFQD